MKKFNAIFKNSYASLIEQEQNLEEAGLIINKKSGAYPKNNNILIMAGGSGSGKSFILDKLLLFNGKVFNPDNTLQSMIDLGKKNPDWSIAIRFKEKYGIELKDIDLHSPDDANKVYEFLDNTRLHYNREAVFFKSVQNIKDKPNVIFDTTLSRLKTLEFIGLYAKLGNYDPKNVHLVWVLNDVTVALDQNAKRNRVVDPQYLKAAHKGAAITFKTIIDYNDRFQEIVDGDIWIVFNKRGVDVKTHVTFKRKNDNSTDYQANINIDNEADQPYVALHMKESGKPAKKWSDIEKPLLDKILEYSKLNMLDK